MNRFPTTGPEARFLAWAIGLVELVCGLTMLLLPFLFEGILYDGLRTRLVPVGFLTAGIGLSLLVWQFLPFQTTRLPQASLLAGGLLALGWALASARSDTWTATSLSAAFGGAMLLTAFGGESKLPAAVERSPFAAALAVGMAGGGLVLLFHRPLASPMYQFITPHADAWGAALLAGAAMLVAWIRHPGPGLSRILPVLAGGILLIWNYEYAFRNQAVLAIVASGVGVAAIMRPFVPIRWLVEPPTRLVNRLVAVSTLLVGVALVLLVVLILGQVEAAYEERAQRDLSTAAALTSADSVALLQNQMRIAALLSRDADVVSLDPERQVGALRRAAALDPAAAQISIVDRTGLTVAGSTGGQPAADNQQNLEGLGRVFETRQANWDLIQSTSLGAPVLAVRAPISGSQGYLAVLVIQVPLLTISGQLQSLVSGLGGRIIIVDNQGRAVVYPDPAFVAKRANLGGLAPIVAARAGRTTPFVYRDGGRRWLAAPAVAEALGWIVDVERPQLLVLAPSIRAREQATVFLAVVLLISGVIAFLFAQGFIRPVAKLVQAARSFGEGAINAALPAPGEDEVGELVYAFGEMRDRLVARTSERERAVHAAAALVQELRESEERFRTQALSDALTGLPNRAYFMDLLTDELTSARREHRALAVLFLDLDGFKTINDSLGHALGDEILVAVGQRLKASRNGKAAVARFGGDEFAVLLDDVQVPAEAVATADRLLAELRRPIEAGSRELVVTASFGVALGGQTHADVGPDDLLRQADIALYEAKAAGKAQAVLFDPQMSARAMERWALENDLRYALARDELRLYYQPIFDLHGAGVVGMEALLRWEHPQRGLLEPEVFVPLAEETGLIIPIGKWVLEEACTQARARRQSAAVPIVISINLSARQLQQPDLVEQVSSILRDKGVEPGQLELELTESVIMRDHEGAIPKLEALKRLGLRIAIDDFGTGYSSLSYLQRLPVDGLKVDRSFISALDRDPGSIGIVQVVIDLAHARGLAVTAEGVETLEQLEHLRALGCDRAQGYYLGLPAPQGFDTPLTVEPI